MVRCLFTNDRIAAVGPRRRIERLRSAPRRKTRSRRSRGSSRLRRFAHTSDFPASRAEEYEQRNSGKTYEEIAKRAAASAPRSKHLRGAPPCNSQSRAIAHLREFAAHGTTTLEAKSGYGLDWKSEAENTRHPRSSCISDQPLDIARTFLGAHMVPPEFRRRPDAFVDLLVKRWIPAVATAGLAEFCDVYLRPRCVYGDAVAPHSRAGPRLRPRAANSRRATRAYRGRAPRHRTASRERRSSRKNRCAAISARLRFRMSSARCFPAAVFISAWHYAPARELIDAGAIVALATDFNPGTSPTLSMSMILSLACTQMRMTPAEAIAAATINPAYSLRLHDRVGSLEVGKYADIAAFDVADYREIPYYFGVNLCSLTMKRGAVIHSKKRL